MIWETKLELLSQLRDDLLCKQENTKLNQFFAKMIVILFLNLNHSAVSPEKQRASCECTLYSYAKRLFVSYYVKVSISIMKEFQTSLK